MRKKIDFNNKIATRESFGKALADIEDEDIVVLDTDLSSSTKTDMFKEKYPSRFFELGISEADMIGTAAGMATCGKKPFVATFAAFATGRVYDQIRCSIAYPNLNVKIIGTHAGITVGEDGATHQMLEDINLMRAMPNMVVVSPSDDIQAKALIKQLAEYEGPAYVRLSRMKTPVIYEGLTEDDFEIGKGIQIGKGTDATIFATGDLLSEALKAQKLLKKANYDVRVVDIHTIKPIDEELIIKCAQETNKLYSLENHSITGGLGTAIAEVLCDKYPHQLTRFGMENEFGRKIRKHPRIINFEGVKLYKSSIIAMNNTTLNAKAANNSPPNANKSISIATTAKMILATIFLNRVQRIDTKTIPTSESVAVAMSCPCARTSITIKVDKAQMSRPCNRKSNILNFL